MIEMNATQPKMWGIVIGYTKRWNPFASQIFAQIKVENQIMNISIDWRQKNIIQKHYPLNSTVPLIFNEGKWEITSDMSVSENKLFSDISTVFL
jgi:hypothetical protein